MPFLNSEFSYPSDFLTIKTRLPAVCRFETTKKSLFSVAFKLKIAFDIFPFSREIFFGEVKKRRKEKIKRIKKLIYRVSSEDRF